MSKNSKGSDMYDVCERFVRCPNFPQKLFSIILANDLRSGISTILA